MKTGASGPLSQSILHRVYPWFIELWIVSVLIVFFLVRILGSSIGQRILALAGHHRLP
jgi:hypothetical protein